MKNATAPACPIHNCPGTFVDKTSNRGRVYRQCNTCGAYDGARFLTKAERERQKREKAAKKARKTEAQCCEEERQAQRQRELEVPQQPVKGWSINEWFPGYEEEPCQMRFHI